MKKLTRKLSWEQDKVLFFLLGLCLLLVAVDFGSKWLVESLLPLGKPVEVIPNFFYLTKSYNTAIAFSLGSSLPMPVGRGINITISLVMSILIAWYFILKFHKLKKFEVACLVLILSGAVGNLIDRAFYWEAITGFNGVIDFLQFYLAGGPGHSQTSLPINPFATFNIADSYLVVGVLMLIVFMFVDGAKENKEKREFASDPRLEEAKESEKAE